MLQRGWSLNTLFSVKEASYKRPVSWFEMSVTGRSIGTESRLVVAMGKEDRRRGSELPMGMEFLFGVMKISWNQRWWLHTSENTKTTELYTLKGWISWYMNYSSIKESYVAGSQDMHLLSLYRFCHQYINKLIYTVSSSPWKLISYNIART